MSGATGGVLATRMVTDGGRPVLIEVGTPVEASDGSGRCGFRVHGMGEFEVRDVDGIAALYRALVALRAVLSRANRCGHRFAVLDATAQGFPVAPSPGYRAPEAAASGGVVGLRIQVTDRGPRAIEIDSPRRAVGRGYYVCAFRIEGRPQAVASGCDAIQALLTALRMIGALLAFPSDWPVSRAR
ncbi:hypothetical protein [Nocardia sp. NPDC048505]|uniref:DUF6968 family protein n=1 Tax=unclassified Nocardia TaxID=2637762 RepID=UPI0033EE4F16